MDTPGRDHGQAWKAISWAGILRWESRAQPGWGLGSLSGHPRPMAGHHPFCPVVTEPLGLEGRVCSVAVMALLVCDPPQLAGMGRSGPGEKWLGVGGQVPVSFWDHPPPTLPVFAPHVQCGQQGPDWGWAEEEDPCAGA